MGCGQTLVRRDAVIIEFDFVVCWRGRSWGPGVELSGFDIWVHDEGNVGERLHFICFVHVEMEKVGEVEFRLLSLDLSWDDAKAEAFLMASSGNVLVYFEV